MKIVNGDIFCEFPDLISWGISEDTIKSGMSRARKSNSSTWFNIPDANDSRKCLIKLTSIPPATQSKIEAAYKKQQKLPKSQCIDLEAVFKAELKEQTNTEAADRLKQLVHQEESLKDFTYFSKDQALPTKKAKDLSVSAALLRLLNRCHKKADVAALRIPGISTKGDLLELALKILKQEQPYGLKVKNKRVLQRRESAFAESGLDSLISEKHGKSNAQKRNEDTNQILLSLYMNIERVGMLLPNQVWQEYMHQVEELNRGKLIVNEATGEVVKELPELSLTTVKYFLSMPNNKAIYSKYRHGSKHVKDALAPYVHGCKPKYALSMTSSDGETTPFWIATPGDPKRGNAYLIFDVFSGTITGWNLDYAETRENMKKAYANMLEFTSGLVPMENQLDNFGRSFKKDLEKIFPFVSFCQPYSPQSKYAENLIGRFENSQLRRHKGWLGSNITAKKLNSRQRPLDKEQKEKPYVYTFDEIKQLYAEAIHAWNNMMLDNGQTRLEYYLDNINPVVERMEPQVMASLFGNHTIIKIDRGVLRMTHRGEDFEYEVPNYHNLLSSLKNGFRVRVRFLPGQLEEKVWIYNYQDANSLELDEYLCECKHIEYTQRAKAEQTEEDGQILGHHLKRARQFAEHFEAEAASVSSFAVLEAVETTEEEAESLLTSGYIGKPEIQRAEEVYGRKRKFKPFDLTEDTEEGGLIV